MNIGVHVAFQTRVFSGQTPRSGPAGSCGGSVLSFLQTLHMVLHGGCISLYFQKMWYRVGGVPLLHTFSSLGIFLVHVFGPCYYKTMLINDVGPIKRS